MDGATVHGDAPEAESCKGNSCFFIEDLSSSEDEPEIQLSDGKRTRSCRQPPRLSSESSPPLLLAFSTASQWVHSDSSQSPAPASDRQVVKEGGDDDSDQTIEEWMILGTEGQAGDSSIQLHLSYWNSSEEESGGEGEKNIWAVSNKDKSLNSRYFTPGRSVICDICSRAGHLAKSCYYHKKCPTCILCGIQGHTQRDCPSRYCLSCGLPSHGLRACERPPLWNQHCQRCGVTGHLADVCPDTWRQYHLTTHVGVPARPSPNHVLKQRQRRFANCYNCSDWRHHGYECTKRRMVSGTSPSLPYVCRYDTVGDVMQQKEQIIEKNREFASAGSLPNQQPPDSTSELSAETQRFRERSKTCGRGDRCKTWPERRRERREVKRLKREAQARWEGGPLGRPRWNHGHQTMTADSLMSPLQCQGWSTPSPQKKRRERRVGEWGRGSRKGREMVKMMD